MNEASLVSAFVRFLEDQKGYPQNSLIYDLRLPERDGIGRIDLAIIDPAENIYLGIIEFKTSNKLTILKQASRQISEYIKSSLFINKYIIPFVVFPSGDNFIIHEFDAESLLNNSPKTTYLGWDFPTFAELTFIIQSRERDEFVRKEIEILSNTQRRARLFEGFGKSAIAGLLAAILGFILSLYTSFIADREKERIELTQYKIIQDLLAKQKKDSIYISSLGSKMSSDTINIQKNISLKKIENRIYADIKERLIKSTESRIRNIESMLSKEPEKTLTILEIKSQISELKLLNEASNNLFNEKLTSLKEKTDFLSNAVWGLFTSIIVTLIGIVAAYFQAKKE